MGTQKRYHAPHVENPKYMYPKEPIIPETAVLVISGIQIVREKSKPDDWSMPFLSHGRCRTCGVWLRYSNNIKCVCCGSKLARKPREWAKRSKYNGR